MVHFWERTCGAPLSRREDIKRLEKEIGDVLQEIAKYGCDISERSSSDLNSLRWQMIYGRDLIQKLDMQRWHLHMGTEEDDT